MDDNVYLGVWTNWSRGPILGQTITMTTQGANTLITFIAVFITFATGRLWKLIGLGLHRFYSTSDPQEAIYHQRQIILRNSTTPDASLFSILALCLAWKNLRRTALTGLLFLALLSLVSFTAFTAAGVLSSRLSTDVGDNVLIRGDNCGLRVIKNNTIEARVASVEYSVRQASGASTYTDQCYDDRPTGTASCNKFVSSRLPNITADYNAACPFDPRMCVSENANVRLDTGYIDGNTDLGFNTANDQSFKWRYVLHCAPLVTDGYTTHLIKEQEVRFHYGNAHAIGPNGNVTTWDYIYETKDLQSQYSKNLTWVDTPKLGWPAFIQKQALDAITYIPELSRSDGETFTIFLSGNGITFLQKMDDEWYRATEDGGPIIGNYVDGEKQGYQPSLAASPMGCVEQYQWCNPAYPGTSGCGPLANRLDAVFDAAPFFNLTPEDVNVTWWPFPPAAGPGAHFSWSSKVVLQDPASVLDVVTYLGATSLASKWRVQNGIMFPLPENQWQLDVKKWFEIVLAIVQQAWYLLVVTTAQGDSDEDARRGIFEPARGDAERKFCHSQRIRHTGYTSFSLFGLIFTFVVGGIIIAASYLAEPLAQRWGYRTYAHLEWVSNSSLQLHRQAHEEHGLRTREDYVGGVRAWKDCTENVPTTEPSNARLPRLDISDPRHPILGRLVDYSEVGESPEVRMIGENGPIGRAG